MKTLLLCAGVALATALQAAETIKLASYSYWSGGSTNAANTLSYLVVPAHPSIANAIPVVMSIDATTDKLAAKVQCYKVTTVAVCAYQTNSTVTLSVVTTNTSPGNISWDSGTVVIRHLLTDQYEKRALTTSIGTTNIVLTAAPLEKVVPGDIIYQVSTTGAPAFTVDTNGVVAATGLSFVRRQGTALVAGQPGMPLLMEIDGTGSSATMNNVTARYEAAGPALPRLTP